MKTIFFCLLLITGSYNLMAQITFEQSYVGEDFTWRTDFPTYGEKYSMIDATTLQVKIHNGDHSLWKAINLPLPAGATDLTLLWIREELVNPDSLLEMAFRYQLNNSFHAKIIDETGLVLLDLPNTSQVYLDEIDGLQDKVIAARDLGTQVYELPFLALGHTYANQNVMERVKLGYAGEKYRWLDRANAALHLYNSDYSLWKTINLPIPINCSINSMRSVSQNKIETDSLLEIVYNYTDSTIAPNKSEQLVNEAGTVLLNYSEAYYIYISEEDGLPNKLIGVNANGSDVYAIPGISLERNYPNETIKRVNLGFSGEKYYHYNSSFNNGAITIHNDDHTFWKTIQIGGSLSINHLSQTKIFPDSLIEIGYNHTIFGPGNPGTNYARITTENGGNLWSLVNSSGTRINELVGFPTKIFAHMLYPSCCFSEVYGVSGYSNVTTLEHSLNTIKTYPNPASKSLTIENPNLEIRKLTLFDVKGRILKQISLTEEKVQLDVSDLAAGSYFLKGESLDRKIYVKKILVVGAEK